jgi:4-amino-4-deoxy-L-arabinose transferase-like glycosyltransferase
MAAAGVHEGAARLPGALLALAAVAALAWAGVGLHGRRAGLIAGAVLAASPLFVLQARQLTSDAPLLLGHALIIGALARLERGRRPARRTAGAGWSGRGPFGAGRRRPDRRAGSGDGRSGGGPAGR